MRKNILAVLLVLGIVVAACAVPTPEVIEKEVVVEKEVPVTVEVEKEKVVEKEVVRTVEVEKEVVVEKVVTATPEPEWVGKQGGTLIVALSGEPSTLDANIWRTDDEAMVAQSIQSYLLRYTADGTLVPDLAESWELAEDNVTWTMHLRQGVKFHDGTDFNAEAVKFSFERLKSEELASPRRSAFDFLDRIEVVDDFTVKMVTKTPYPMFLDYMAYPAAAILSPAAVEKWGEEYGRHPVGTGPFKFEEWVPDDRIVLHRNEDYWDGAPYLEKLIFKPVPETATRVILLETGECDVITNIRLPKADMDRLRGNPDLVLGEPSGPTFIYLSINALKEPFSDVRVRQALNYAVNKQALVEYVLGEDFTAVIRGIGSSRLKGFAEMEPEGWPYDPERAKQLLKEAGYPDGFSAKLLVTEDRYLNDREMAQVVADQLADVGIEVTVEAMEYGAYSNMLNKQEFDIAEAAWGAIPPSIETLRHMFYSTSQPRLEGGYNRGGYVNERVDELLDTAESTADPEEWARLWKEAQEIIWEEAPHIFMYEIASVYANRANVKGHVLLTSNRLIRFERAYKE